MSFLHLVPLITSKSKTLDSGCIKWQGAVTKAGYPTLNVNGKKEYVHRILARIYLELDSYPDMHVMHKCDNPKCININHLKLGTPSDNMKDCAEKNRVNNQNFNKEFCVSGHEFTDANTYISYRRLATGMKRRRHCRACMVTARKRFQERNK